MKLKVTVLGAGGMLGSDLVPVWRDRSEISSHDHGQCDVSDRDRVTRVLEEDDPDVVLMLAAATDVDRCQIDPDYAFGTNAVGTEIVAQACSRIGASIVYISSIAVFSGDKGSPYNEYDIPSPCNTYGMSKLHGEKAVRTFCPKHWIVRTGWLFGGGEKDMKFVARILRKISLNHEIRVVRDCVGSPTFTGDLARGLLDLVSEFQYGTYHLVNGGIPTSRYELAIETMKIAGYSEDLIIPCLSSDFDLPAPRPRMEAASSLKLGGSESGLKLPHWRDSLSDYVRGTLRALIQ
jgi:dTDP-4-dehydrorhamnose reductase